MSNESALMRSVCDQLDDFIQKVKTEIEPNEVMIPISWRDGGRYNRKDHRYSRPLPEHIQEQLDVALKAPSIFRCEINESELTAYRAHPDGFQWWDELYWPVAQLRSRMGHYVDEMNK